MSWQARLSFRRKLALIIIGISSISALSSCTLLGVYSWVTYRDVMPGEFQSELILYAGVTGMILLASGIVTVILSVLFQKWISAPILGLAKVVRRVSDHRDYSIRATRISRDEIGELTDGINHMLHGIQTRNEALRQSNDSLHAEIAERRKVENDLRLLTETLEQRVAERTAAAEAANQAKSEFLANVSHELRTPLNSVIGFTNLVLKNKAGNLRAEDIAYLERILANGRHLLRLINEVLDLSKIESRKIDLDLADVDLKALVQEILTNYESQLGQRQIELLLDAPEQVGPLRSDPGKLRQILLNLIGNGIKFTEHGYVLVSIVTEPATHYPIRIDVNDTGIGIATDRQSVIFEAFRHADNNTARRYGGTGLGLTISMALCRLLGYRLDVCSEEGRGSTFSIWFSPKDHPVPETRPAKLPSPSLGASPPAPDIPLWPDPLQDRVILVISDDEGPLLLLTRILEDAGCVVLPATSIQEGFRLARKARPDAIVLNFLLPDADGAEVLEKIKADPSLKGCPVVTLLNGPLALAETTIPSIPTEVLLQKTGNLAIDLRQTLSTIIH